MRDSTTRFVQQVIDVPPGGLLDHDAPIWQDAIVVVLAGRIVVECARGERHRFVRGDILSFARLPLRRVHNEDPCATRLLAISRTG